MNENRNTVQRQLILKTVRNMHTHPTAEAVYSKIAVEHPTVSRGTVYRNLKILSQKGEINHVKVPGCADRYDFNTEKHYHIRCEVCNVVYDVDMPYMHGLCSSINNKDGFIFKSHEIIFNGICKNCK